MAAPVPPPPRPDVVAVLAAPGVAPAVGSAIALALARGPVMLSLLGAERPALRGPAPRATAKLAARLVERGHDAAPVGRLAVVELGDAAEALRVCAAAGVPAVTVLAAPRDREIDRTLAAHDRVVVVGEGIVADLAATGVAALGVRTDLLALPDAPAARVLAAAGVALAKPWHAAVDEALR